jgi:cell division protein FtsW
MVVVSSAIMKEGFSDGIVREMIQKHIVTLFLSAIIMLVCYLMPATLMRWGTRVAYIVAWILTLIPYFQSAGNGDAHRWIDLGFIQFQPSELLKITTIMLLAARLSARHHSIKRLRLLPSTFDVRKWKTPQQKSIFREDILPIVLPIAMTCMVILPDATSSAVHIFIVSLAMLFLAGVRFWEICKLFFVSVVLGLIVLFMVGRFDTVVERVKDFVGTEKVEPREQLKKDTYRSCMAINNGGFFGVGAGRSVMRGRLTHPESDYIFAVVVEEFGLILSFVIVLLYLWIFFRSLRIFERCEWLYGGLLSVGLALLVTSQGFLHVGVAIGVLPETGQNLPFLTQGRTGMFCAAIALGLILSISRQVDQGTLRPPKLNIGPNDKIRNWLWK